MVNTHWPTTEVEHMVKTLVANNTDPGVSNLTRVHSVCFQDQISATDVKWPEKDLRAG